MEYRSSEKRKFFRVPFNKTIQYKTLSFANETIITLKKNAVISQNLSASGISFTSKDHPELSSIILLDLNPGEIPFWKTISDNVLMFHGQPLGKVIRVEDREDGQYGISVAFIASSGIISKKLINLNRHNLTRFFLFTLFALIIIYAAASVVLNYVEYKETYQPNRSIYITPIDIGLKYEEVDFQTEDAQVLHGWFIPAESAKATVLYLQGRSGNMCDELSNEKFLNSMGLNVLIFDYRGYGRNSGRPSERGLYKDARGAYDYLISRKDINKEKIIIIGESLGGAVAADLCLHRKATALILESPIVSLAMQARRLFPFLPADLLLIERYDTLSKIKNIRIPKLIVHGIDDESIAFDDVVSLFYAAPNLKKFLPFHGAHDDSMYKISDAYKAELTKFLDDNNLR